MLRPLFVQAIWELQASFFRRVESLWNTPKLGRSGHGGESSDDVFVDCISGHDELPCEGSEDSQDEGSAEANVSSNGSSARSFSPRALGAPSARAWEGAVVVLEGPIGCGKSCILTHALETFTRRSHGDHLSNTDTSTKLDTLSLCAGGDPFYRTLYLGVWRTIVMNFLSEESRLRRNRGQEVCREGEVLQAMFREQYPLLCPWLPVLAQLLPLGAVDAVPDTDESRFVLLLRGMRMRWDWLGT